MPSIVHEFSGAGVAQVLVPAPSGSRYVISHLTTTAGVATVRTIPTSGVVTATSSDSSITNMRIHPSGDTGYAEALEVEASAAATVTVGYVLQAPNGRINDHAEQHTVRQYFDDANYNARWYKDPISGDFAFSKHGA